MQGGHSRLARPCSIYDILKFMLAYIKGKVFALSDRYLIVQNAGLGYKIFVAQNTISDTKIGAEIELFIYQFIREDKNELYGFKTQDELDFFELLISVSGVGPKSALAILELDNLDNIKSAISAGDHRYLSQVSGIGVKTAKKLLLELQDKLPQMAQKHSQEFEDLFDALETLGYKKNDIKKVMQKLSREKTLEEQIKDALQLLS